VSNSKTYQLAFIDVAKDIGQLVKFKLSLMVVFSSVISYVILAGSQFEMLGFILLLCGGLFITFSANAINQVLEKDFDRMMQRTRLRPLADQRMSSSTAVLIAGIFTVLGSISLAMISPLCATLGMGSLILYAFIYTPLKRYSTLAIPVGAIPGALPVLVAGVAAQGTITLESLSLFGIQYLWQFPHFWAIAWLGHEDYKSAGFKLIKDIDGAPDPRYGFYSSQYSLLSIAVLIPLIMQHYFNPFILIALILCILIYSWYGIRLFQKNDRQTARALMFCSIIYLPVVLILMLINNSL